MQIRKIIAAMAFTLLCLPGFVQTNVAGAGKGALTGRVVDDVDDSPIQGAAVQATEVGGHLLITKHSDLDGSYKIEGLPAHSKFNVTYQKQGYLTDQHEIIVTAEQEARLLNLHGDQSYYVRKAAKIKEAMARLSGPEQEKASIHEWAVMADGPLPPAAKGVIARALQDSAPRSLRASPLFAAYATADPAVLDKLDLLRTLPDANHDWLSSYQVSIAIIDNIQKSPLHDPS